MGDLSPRTKMVVDLYWAACHLELDRQSRFKSYLHGLEPALSAASAWERCENSQDLIDFAIAVGVPLPHFTAIAFDLARETMCLWSSEDEQLSLLADRVFNGKKRVRKDLFLLSGKASTLFPALAKKDINVKFSLQVAQRAALVAIEEQNKERNLVSDYLLDIVDAVFNLGEDFRAKIREIVGKHMPWEVVDTAFWICQGGK